ncbi:DNA-directed RNA polymerase alpha subunit [Mycoplasmopsis meleagridis]|uniref:DNA-directed RNA polymerase subunit alpha n=1 Tax=Mycoplasmopsis meleagridis ATCC 25294 TaxID=1264554 RepID=A0A0F5H194_9BACT|nr:DNA-directed RNA polymerase subunit alpha [Mycoplasmopsis meleagridis]KKB27076.1 DNA-directed RNA polymerase alpha subunit [Mycoplasmopsis meleagridis ATCC 25294]OAD18320.1 DNA-directed RNA polymerase alpha subunit [Mycoplasmopsis meleagridis]VEU77377.1 DNA-directed RNA polymerase alpha chain [Mycoplasmopsis meleagridis]
MEKMPKLVYQQVQNLSENINETTFSLKPLERGFGNTLGVALRRTLISSITALALVAVKIEGIDHEFEIINGVEEDVVTLIMNLRKVKFQYNPDLVSDDDIIKVTLKTDELGAIYSNLLVVDNSNIEILNKNQYIATLNKGQLHLEMFLRTGRGFISNEENKKYVNNSEFISKTESKIKKGIFIATDSDFSPVKKVNYVVNELNSSSNNFEEELVFTLLTNGTIDPKYAIKQACEILVGTFKLIGDVDEMKLQIFAEEKIVEVEEKDDDIDISKLGLSVRSFNALWRIGMRKLSEICNMTLEELEQTKNLGRKSIDEIISVVKEHGRELKKGEE